MTTRRDISLNVIADISKYQQQFAKIPGYTDKQAAKAAGALEKRMSKSAADSARAAERAAAKSARAFERAGKGPAGLAGQLDTIADKSGDLDSVIQGLGGALGAIDPRLQAVATGFSDAAGGIEAVSKAGVLSIGAMGAVGVAVAALGAAYLVLSHDVEEAQKAQERAAKRATEAQAAFGGFADSIRALDTEIAKLTGSYDAEGEAGKAREAAFNRQSRAAEKFIAKQQKRTTEEQKRLRAEIAAGDASDETQAKLDRVNGMLSRQIGQLEAVRDRAEDFRATNTALTEELQARAEAEDDASNGADKVASSDDAAAAAAERRAAAEAALKKAVDRALAAGEAKAKQADQDIKLREQNTELIKEATAVELSELGKVAAATDAQLAKAEEIRVQRMQNAGSDYFLRIQAQEEFEAAQTAIEAKYAVERTRVMEEQSQARQALMESERAATAAAVIDFGNTTMGALNDTFSGMSQLAAQAGSGKEARRLFRISKVTGAAVTLINTYVAAQKALAQLGPVAGGVAAGAITAAGLTRVAIIRNQKMPAFYRGTSMVRRPDGGAGDAVPAVLHEGEAVLTRRAAQSVGRAQIDNLNAGGGSAPPTVVAISQMNHRQFRSFYRSDRQLPGSLTRGDRNRSGSRVGRQL